MKEKLTKVESMFRKDALVLSVFIAFTAIIMIFVALQIVGMGGEGALEYVPAVIACISIVAMASGTSSRSMRKISCFKR